MCNWSKKDILTKTNLNRLYKRKTSNLDLNVSTLGEVTTLLGKEFQSFVIHWEKVKHLVEVVIFLINLKSIGSGVASVHCKKIIFVYYIVNFHLKFL